MNKRFLWGILALSLVFGMMVVGARKAKEFEVIKPITPDENSAVVYFKGIKGFGDIWDGETVVGSFFTKTPTQANIVWKTTPGPHYFMANASNWAVILADLEPNKQYCVSINPLPSPPFTKLITIQVLPSGSGEVMVKKYKTISFTDEWRAEYTQGKRLQEAQGQLQAAKGREIDVTLGGVQGW